MDIVDLKKEFPIGTRVEILINSTWRKGTVVEISETRDALNFIVKCDEQVSKNMDFYGGHGASFTIGQSVSREAFLEKVRKIKEQCAEAKA